MPGQSKSRARKSTKRRYLPALKMKLSLNLSFVGRDKKKASDVSGIGQKKTRLSKLDVCKRIADDAGKNILVTSKRLRSELTANTVKAGYVVIVWDNKEGVEGRPVVRCILPFMVSRSRGQLICVPFLSAFASNDRRLDDGKHILRSVIEDIISGGSISESTAVERIMMASRQFIAQAQAIAMQVSSTPGAFCVYD